MEFSTLGSRILDMDRCKVADARDKLFETVLEALAATDVFSQPTTPSLFIVYAHDNAEKGVAHAGRVRDLIEWLRAIRSRTLSDKHTLPLWSTLEQEVAATQNIVDSQWCLLPSYGVPYNPRNISSVDKVIVCGSEVLRTYYEDDLTSSYIGSISSLYAEHKNQYREQGVLRRQIKALVDASCHNSGFHHVLTELAFLELRKLYGPDKHGIIPVSLDGERMDYIPCLEGSDLFLKLKSPEKGEKDYLYRLFFKILGKIYIPCIT